MRSGKLRRWFDFSVGLLSRPRISMRSPATSLTEIGSYTKSKDLTEEYVAAVSGVNGDDSVVLGELADPSLSGSTFTFAVHTANPIIGIAESVKNLFADSCHNIHIKNNID